MDEPSKYRILNQNSDIRPSRSWVDAVLEFSHKSSRYSTLEVSYSEYRSSWTVAAFLLVNTALGAGLLNYPYAYNKAGGILEASLLQVFMACFLSATMMVLAYCADINGDETYHDVLLSVVGRRAQQLSAFSILLTCFGVCITFLIIIGDQYDRFFLSVHGMDFAEYWYMDRHFTIAATACLLILPMCYFKRLDFLRYASSLGIFAMLYPVFLTMYEYYTMEGPRPPINTGPRSIVDLLTVIPVICFAYQTHEIVIPVYACMRDRNIKAFIKVTGVTMIFLMANYFLAGTYGYMTFGANVSPDIMQQYDAKNPLILVGIVALVVKMITSYPPLVLCGRGAIEGLYAEFVGQTTAQFIEGELVRRFIITTFWFVATVMLAIFIPNISVVIEVLGCVAAINIFVFPVLNPVLPAVSDRGCAGLCLYYLTKKNGEKGMSEAKKRLLKGLAFVMIIFGIFIFIVVFYEVAEEHRGPADSDPVICFAYQTHEIVIPVYACMRDRNIKAFIKVTGVTMIFLMANYFLAGTYGYMTFGANVSPDIMQQYDAKNPLILVGIVALVVKMITSYPPLVLCGRGAIEGLYAEFVGQTTAQFIEGELVRRFIITTFWFVATVMLAIFIPNISVVIEVLGCVAAINIFVFPVLNPVLPAVSDRGCAGLCLYYLTKKNGEKSMSEAKKRLLKGLAFVMIIFGIFIFIVVFYEVVSSWTTGSAPNV
ncbi:SLC38A7 [Cordylochernes scorpioides]|uniref:SLC38A7 n=1 Tax=Cordylochernes scorpioides TaxID=51811 RepID=A0ABY6KIY2_9ARAC|nr:SLC38A7 [Cordylochernes scorpioides]